MQIGDIVEFWNGEQQVDERGRWAHRLDRKLLNSEPHSFNLDYPVSPYIGDVLNAPVVILGANAGYNSDLTPTEFPDAASVSAYIARVDDPSGSDWSFVSRYYDRTNYGHLVAAGKAVVVNACAYRSPKLSEEADNRAVIKRLPSSVITRRWLLEAVLPLAARGERLIVVKRGGQWKLPKTISTAPGVTVDPAPVSSQITGVPFAQVTAFLANRS
ncbi:hypothetical protein [Tsuneonella troitsensis]|uniref:hypothetical protein n=1 Tax=Tsuneonella troitsensis TaxID=292222 RepID=UPI000A7C1142|nr:hypothetical protein [Tsuneonella troitsensis]